MSAPLLYLASKSPRRQALLQQLGIEFETLLLREAVGRERDIVEEALDAEPPLHYVERIARTTCHGATCSSDRPGFRSRRPT